MSPQDPRANAVSASRTSITDALSQRASINIEIGRITDQLNVTRWANGTQPQTIDDWRQLIDSRASDLDPRSVDELLGLAADVHGLLEHWLREEAA